MFGIDRSSARAGAASASPLPKCVAWAASVSLSLALATAAAADPGEPAPVAKLLQCRSLPDPATRLTCYDVNVEAFQVATREGDLVVSDRRQRADSARAAFGHTGAVSASGPNRARKSPNQTEPVERIDSIIVQASPLPNGRWAIVLNDGARWQQTDDRVLARDPRPGMPVVIRRAAMGSYLGNVGGQIAIRLRRAD